MKHLFELSVGMLLSLILVLSSAGNYLRAQNHFDGLKSVENSSINKVDGFLGPDQTICFGEEVRLEAPLAFSYVWSTGQTTQFIIVKPVDTKEYWVRIINLQNVVQSDTAKVIVNPLPEVNITPSSTQLLPGEAVLLTASGASSYIWSNGDQTNTSFVSPAMPENTFWVDGTDLKGCVNRAEAFVFVNYTTNPSFTYTPVCIGDTTFFQAAIQTNDTILSIDWDLDGDLMFDDGTGTTQKKLFTEAGEWLVGIKVTTKYSPTPHSTYIPVKVGDPPLVDFEFTKSCAILPIQFTDLSKVNIGEVETWNWQFGDGQVSDIQNPINTYQQSGVYNVTLQVTTTAGCNASYGRSYNAAAPPNVSIGYADGSNLGSQPLVLFRNDTIRLKAIGIFDSVSWNGRISGIIYTVTRPGNYVLIGYRGGCMNSTSVSVVQSDQPYDPALKIQNILTPNGDGFNDVWKISMLNSIQPAKVSIYTRAGLPVLETTNYNNNWDGTYLNNPLPEGSYFYVIEGADGEVFNGSITLLR